LKKEWNVLLYTLLGLMGAALVLFVCVPNRFIVLRVQWLKSVQAHNVQLDQSPNTIYFIIQKILSSVHMAIVPTAAVLIGLAIAGLTYLKFIWKNVGKGFQSNEALLLLALIPVLTHTDTEHFLWAMPFFIMLLISISTWNKRGKWIAALLLFAASIPFLFNSPDIVGKTLSKQLDEGGIGLSLILLLVLSFFYRSVKFFKNRFI
jgi:hypothetical protein